METTFVIEREGIGIDLTIEYDGEIKSIYDYEDDSDRGIFLKRKNNKCFDPEIISVIDEDGKDWLDDLTEEEYEELLNQCAEEGADECSNKYDYDEYEEYDNEYEKMKIDDYDDDIIDFDEEI